MQSDSSLLLSLSASASPLLSLNLLIIHYYRTVYTIDRVSHMFTSVDNNSVRDYERQSHKLEMFQCSSYNTCVCCLVPFNLLQILIQLGWILFLKLTISLFCLSAGLGKVPSTRLSSQYRLVHCLIFILKSLTMWATLPMSDLEQ